MARAARAPGARRLARHRTVLWGVPSGMVLSEPEPGSPRKNLRHLQRQPPREPERHHPAKAAASVYEATHTEAKVDQVQQAHRPHRLLL